MPPMIEWALELLQCLNCRRAPLRSKAANLICPDCGAVYPVRDGIADFLQDAHPTVVKERSAVEDLSNHPEAVARLRLLLHDFDRRQVTEEGYREYECLRHAEETRAQIIELLRQAPVRNQTVLEIGADHCWTSNLLLDAGCRVIASDVTSHLQLASRAGDPNLVRIYSDMNRLPLQDSSVDVVWATSAAHHSWDLSRTFREAARILNAGGRLYLCCEPIPSLVRWLWSRDFGHRERQLGINETWIRRKKWLQACIYAGMTPVLCYPQMDDRTLKEKLRRHNLPDSLSSVARLFHKQLQVSIHLLATKPFQ